MHMMMHVFGRQPAHAIARSIISEEDPMRRTTQWAVFTSMNQKQPVWRSMLEPADRSAPEPVADPLAPAAAQSEPEAASAPDTRRDRVDFM